MNSDSLAAYGYDRQARVLRIRFRAGGLYDYFGVPRAEADALAGAESKGRHFVRRIRDRYEYRRVG